MRAEILSIGSELTSGQNLDTNACWLSDRLSEMGIPVAFHTTVGDDLQDLVEAFRIAVGRAQLVVATGGLGPTADDLTRDALAQLAGVELVLDPPSLEHIEQMFHSRGREMPARNRMQAMFPAGATPIHNAHGTAPGIWMLINDAAVACMPGVPGEMFEMFHDEVAPRLKNHFRGESTIVHRTLRCFGAGESHIEELLGDLTARNRYPEVGITASQATISLRITAKGKNPDEARREIEPVAQTIYDKLGDLVYGEEDEELQHVVVRMLRETGVTVSTAESCTGGLVGHLLTEISGVSSVYRGGVVSYSNEAKIQLLGVDEQLLNAKGAVSPEVAAAMATGCRQRFGSDLAVAVTGIAGPGGGSAEKPVGLVYIALAHAGGIETAKYNWASDRSSTKLRSAKTALNLIRLHLLQR